MKPQWLDDFNLDGDEGPAPKLDADEAHALASKVVDRALSNGVVGSQLRRSRWIVAILGAAGALAVLGAFYERSKDAHCASGTCDETSIESPSAKVVVGSIAPPPVPSPIEPAPPAPLESLSVAALPNASAKPPVASAPQTASDMLAEANRARRDHSWARAASLYEKVMSSRADESYAATVALASLRLEHFDDARGALALYERALSARPGGALSAQAEAGAARCRRALGDE